MSIKEHPPQQQIMHVPVLLDSALEQLNPKPGENYLDLTAGYGGHASSFLNITGNYADSVLVDRDECTLKYLRPLSEKGAKLINADFVAATKQLVKEGRQFDIVMVDLGVSSPQLDQSQRGFSFTNNGPLDMRMDRRQELTAAKLINTASREEMAHIINQYGEEPIKSSSKKLPQKLRRIDHCRKLKN
jgi:16S rRNA (cytosine1402-N4)-methyltransferase